MTTLIGTVRRWLGLEPAAQPELAPAAPAEPLVVGKNATICVCDEEYCFCTRLVPSPLEALAGLAELGVGIRLGNNPCPQCRAGEHVWSPQ
jgi:hypothetical protein